MGAASLLELFEEKYYSHLEGGILESFGRLFKNALKVYVYPYLEANGELLTVANLVVAPELRKLYSHLVERGSLEQLDGYNAAYLHIFSRDVLRKIKSGDPAWQQMVPPAVAELIIARGYFGYSGAQDEAPMTVAYPEQEHGG